MILLLSFDKQSYTHDDYQKKRDLILSIIVVNPKYVNASDLCIHSQMLLCLSSGRNNPKRNPSELQIQKLTKV